MKSNIKKLIYQFVENNISIFHQKRLSYIEDKIDLNKILKQKNPYLFKAKNIQTPESLIRSFIDAFLQSQEETFFGGFMEELAIFVCKQSFKAKKSELTGIDLEFQRNNIWYIVEIKAGWNWGNSSQIKQLRINFTNAIEQLKKQGIANVVAVNGCCFGKDNKQDKTGYLKLCGQSFWELISGDSNLYIDIIEPIGYKAKKHNDDFQIAYNKQLTKLSLQFGNEYCTEGQINWENLIKYNSGK